MSGSITDVAGVRVGHAQDAEAKTGCTVILAPEDGATNGFAWRGASPATRETDLLRIDGIAKKVHAVMLSGGSAFGLDAASGAMRWLEAHGIGFPAGVATVPIVPAFSLFDLAWGRPDVRPDAAMGETACEAASATTVKEGAAGAGTGAAVGKLFGMDHCCQSGVGTASGTVKDITIGALTVSNAFGDIVDEDGDIVAGTRDPESGQFVDTAAYLRENGMPIDPYANCTFAVVCTDMALERPEANRLAEMAFAGIARAVSPAHPLFDYDALVVLSCGDKRGDLHAAGAVAAKLVHEALVSGVRAAQ